MISIIIPCCNERLELDITLRSLVADKGGSEVIVVDGGSIDGSVARSQLAVQRRPWVHMIETTGGRGALINAGAAEAKGDVLLILYPGTTLERGWLAGVEKTMSSGHDAGAFRWEFCGKSTAYRLIESRLAIRSRMHKIPVGQQALFVRKDLFEELGGYLDLPVCEDLEFGRRLRDNPAKIKFLSLAALDLGREYERDGILYRAKKEQQRFKRFLKGAQPDELLACGYGGREAVIVWYTKDHADSIGDRVKRLQGEGMDTASNKFVMHTLDLASGPPVHACTILSAVPGAAIDPWMDVAESRHQLTYQVGANLGERLLHAFREAYALNMEKVIVVDPICPKLDDITLRYAFDYLQNYDVVIGPTTDGACYLVGTKEAQVDFLEAVDWEAESSLDAVIATCRERGLRFHQLAALKPLESVEDLRYFHHMGLLQY